MLIVPGPDKIAVGQLQRRVGGNAPAQQVGELRQGVQKVFQEGNRVPRHVAKQSDDFRGFFQGAQQAQTVPGVQRMVGHLGQQPFHIVDLGKLVPEVLGKHMLAVKRLHGGQPGFDFFFAQKRLFHPGTQKPAAHGGDGFI